MQGIISFLLEQWHILQRGFIAPVLFYDKAVDGNDLL